MYNNYNLETRAKIGAPAKTRKSENAKARALAEPSFQFTPESPATSYTSHTATRHVEFPPGVKQSRGQFADRGFISPYKSSGHDVFMDGGYGAEHFEVGVDREWDDRRASDLAPRGFGDKIAMGVYADDRDWDGRRTSSFTPPGFGGNIAMGASMTGGGAQRNHAPDEDFNCQFKDPQSLESASSPTETHSKNLLRKAKSHLQHRTSHMSGRR